jgi:hypothetical protein
MNQKIYLALKVIAAATGITSNGVFAWLMYKATIAGYIIILDHGTAPYGEQYIEIPLAIFGAIVLFVWILNEVYQS